jgi:hypothetical protein
MATDKKYSVTGISKHNGEYKVRFANDVMRVKVLAKHGHEDITLVELPNEMTKLEAVKFIKGLDEMAGVAAQAAISDYLDRNDSQPTAAKAPVKAPKAAKKTTVTDTVMAQAKAKAKKEAVSEDSPF